MQGIYGLSGVISEKLIEILCRRDSDNHADLTKLIISSFTKSSLLEARRKIFDFAIAKEKEKRALATARGDATTDDTDQCSGIHMRNLEQWDLDNRGNKPKVANDIAALSLYIEDPGETFPVHILAKSTSTAKGKTKSLSPVRNTSSSSSDDASPVKSTEVLPLAKSATSNELPGKQQNPVELQKTFESFVIKEVCGVESNTPDPNDRPVSITALIDSSTSTREHNTHRSIGTQTVISGENETGPCQRKCCTDNLPQTSPEPPQVELSRPGANPITSTDKSSTSELYIRAPEVEGKNPHNSQPVNEIATTPDKSASSAQLELTIAANSCNSDIISDTVDPERNAEVPPKSPPAEKQVDKTPGQSTEPPSSDSNDDKSSPNSDPALDTTSHSDTSLLDYIDSEYESVKKRNLDMYTNKREDRAGSEQERRISILEANYDKVIKRLCFVEKDHTREICEIKAEQRRLNYLNAGDSCSFSKKTPRNRRHSSSDVEDTPQSYAHRQGKHPTPTAVHDNNSWDVNDTNVFVSTQDSQGQQIVTRATPFHLKELGITSVPQAGTSKSSANDSTPGRALTNRAPNAKSTPHTAVVDLNKVQFVDGMDDIPPLTRNSQHENRAPMNQRALSPPKRAAIPSTTQTSKAADAAANVERSTRAQQRPVTIDFTSDDDSEHGNAAKRSKLSTSVDLTTGSQQRPTATPTGEQGNKPTDSSATPRERDDNVINDKESYASKASKERPWTTVGKDDKFKKRSVPPLKGLINAENKEMFIKGLKRADFRDRKELEESVKIYCVDRGINLIHHRVLAFKSSRATVGCKVVVSIEDAKLMRRKSFWPPGVWAREWYDDDPTEKPQASGNDKSSADESTG